MLVCWLLFVNSYVYKKKGFSPLTSKSTIYLLIPKIKVRTVLNPKLKPVQNSCALSKGYLQEISTVTWPQLGFKLIPNTLHSPRKYHFLAALEPVVDRLRESLDEAFQPSLGPRGHSDYLCCYDYRRRNCEQPLILNTLKSY